MDDDSEFTKLKLIKDLEDIDVVNDHITNGVLIAKSDGEFTVTHANKGFFKMIGFSKEEFFRLYKNKVILALHPDETDVVVNSYNEQVKTNLDSSFRMQTKIINKNSGYFWIYINGKLCYDKFGNPEIYFMIVDVTDYIKLVQQLEMEQEHIRLIQELTNDSFFTYDVLSQKFTHSRHFAERFNISNPENNSLQSFVQSKVISEESMPIFHKGFEEATKHGLATASGVELKLRLPDGGYVWYNLHFKIIFSKDGTPYQIVGKLSDITEQKGHIDFLTKKAQSDSLTKLYNKEETRLRIEKYIKEAKQDEHAGFLIVDIDNFKMINDNLGHHVGDTVLQYISGKIKGMFRESDIIGRMGGDEFIVFMRNIKEKIVDEKAEELTKAFNNFVYGENENLNVSVSIGVALFPSHGSSFEELYQKADIALYESKRKGKDCYSIFCPMFNKKAKTSTTKKISITSNTDITFEEILSSIFKMLYETNDMKTTINIIISLIGQKFHCDRCFIMKRSRDRLSIAYEWCAEGVSFKKKYLQNIDINDAEHIFADFDVNGVYYCNSQDEINNSFDGDDVKSLIRLAIYNYNETTGFLCLNSTVKERKWSNKEIAVLSCIAKMLSAFLETLPNTPT